MDEEKASFTMNVTALAVVLHRIVRLGFLSFHFLRISTPLDINLVVIVWVRLSRNTSKAG